jgi:hypothetical protein
MEASNSSNNKLLAMVDNMVGGGGQDMKAISGEGINVDLNRVGEVAQAQQSGGGTNIFDMLKELNSSQLNMDSLMEQLGTGKQWSTKQILQMQFFAHQHTITYEMVTKFGEMAGRAVQGPFQMQV